MAKTVIIVDDDQDDLDVINETIKSIDDTILCTSFIYPEEALRVITRELMSVPDYIFMDLNMPRMKGDALLLELRKIERLNNTVIAILSTSISDLFSIELKQAGADFTFQKPITLPEYQAIIQSVFKEKRKVISMLSDDIARYNSFRDLPLSKLNKEQSSVYVIDYYWNYLFANPYATEKMKGYNVIGKNITVVWKELPQYNFQPVYSMLKDNVDNKEPIEILQKSPITQKGIRIVGQPLTDCYLFNISELS